jgi:transposase-like protein
VKASGCEVELSRNRFTNQEAFVSHANALLTPRARLRLAKLVVQDGWTYSMAAKMFTVSPRTAAKWANRYRAEGIAGMADRSSRLRTHSNLHDMAANLEAGLSEIRRAVSSMRMWNDRAPQEPFAVYRIGLQTTRLLMMLAELLVGWLLLRQAVIAEGKLADPTIDSDHRSFYVGKIAVARFFGAERLPVLTMERQLLESDSTIGVMTISDDAL